MIKRAWDTYCMLFDNIRSWALQFIDDDSAQQVARDVLAEEFLLAARGFITQWGVLESIRSTSTRVLARFHAQYDERAQTSSLWAWPAPSLMFVEDVSWLYATALHFVENTYQDEHLRMNIMAGIRLTTPQWMTHVELAAYWSEPGVLPRKLHQSWKRFATHECGDTPVCQLSQHAEKDEYHKGLRWLEWETTRQAGEAWQKLQRSQSS